MASPNSPALTGTCQCGRLTYTCAILPREFDNCHCQACRRISGSPFLTFYHIPTAALTWTSDRSSLKRTRYSDIAERTHCMECGSPLTMQYDCQPDRISVTAGSIVEESVKGALPNMNAHIFVGDKAGWYNIPNDGLEKCERFDGNFQQKIDEGLRQKAGAS